MSLSSARPGTDGTGWRDSVDAIRAAAESAARRGVVSSVAPSWVAFRCFVVRLQFARSESLTAAVTGGVFVLPATVGLIGSLDPLADPQRLVPS